MEVDSICRETGFLAISGHGVPQDVDRCGVVEGARLFRPAARGEACGEGAVSRLPLRLSAAAGGGAGEVARVSKPRPTSRRASTAGRLRRRRGSADPEALGFCYAPTIWPSEPAGFVEAWQAYYRAMEGPGAAADAGLRRRPRSRQKTTSSRSSTSRSARCARSTIPSRRRRPCRDSFGPGRIATMAA